MDPLGMDQLAPGTMVGEYQIESKLGEGGMGVVYAAVHPVIAKRAAVKVLHPAHSVNRDSVERFVQEARAVNQIGHPNIIDIFAFGALPDGRSYFVMERLRGESLGERLERSRLSVRHTLAIADRIVDALAAAHDTGIVHRDLKPDNVFLVESKAALPQIKLLDFGIAKLMTPTLAHRTESGNLMGTPAYMSPEQARGYNVDHRTDIYALGAMLYRMLTGRFVFHVDSAAEMIAGHLTQAPDPLRAHAPADAPIPPALEALVMQMLAKDPAQRPTLARISAEVARLAQEPEIAAGETAAMAAMTGEHAARIGDEIRTGPRWEAAQTQPAGHVGVAVVDPGASMAMTAKQSGWRPPRRRSVLAMVVAACAAVAAVGVTTLVIHRESRSDAATGGSDVVEMTPTVPTAPVVRMAPPPAPVTVPPAAAPTAPTAPAPQPPSPATAPVAPHAPSTASTTHRPPPARTKSTKPASNDPDAPM